MKRSAVKASPNGITPFTSSQEYLLAGLAWVEERVRQAIQQARDQGALSNDRFRGLYLTEDMIDQALAQTPGLAPWNQPNGHHEPIADGYDLWQKRIQLSQGEAVAMPLEMVRQRFGLTSLERDLLLLMVAPELDRRYERFYAYLQDDVTKQRPTIDLLLNLISPSLGEKMERQALFLPEGVLVRNRLVHCYEDGPRPHPGFTAHFVRPARSLVHFLGGHRQLSPRLTGCATWKQVDNFAPPPWLPEQLWTQVAAALPDHPLLALIGPYGVGKSGLAQAMAHHLGQPLLEVDLLQLAEAACGLEEGIRLVVRDGTLHQAVLYLTGWDTVLTEHRSPSALLHPLLTYEHIAIVAGEKLWQPRTGQKEKAIYFVTFPKPEYAGRLRLWQHHLGDAAANLDLVALANYFDFTPGQISDAVTLAHDMARWQGQHLNNQHLLQASRTHSNQNLADLATKITPHHTWHDLILPPDPLAQLGELVNQARNRPVVYDQWGYSQKLQGRGVSVLFTGDPGTGKTMSASIIAAELGLDLYKVDLASLVSKYIGETEKNLDRVFVEANTSNAILFFDEADAIFGKRSEVKDSHDRYANLEISYLLQRMEAYDGIAILATNMRANLDEAFTRRFNYIIDFPFPDVEYREALWRIHFLTSLPLTEGIDVGMLARRFRLAGGNIKNIVVAAAFLAAHDQSAISPAHILHAARREYQKMGRLIEDSMFE